MIFQKKPKHSWFINSLIIFLICILITNSILASIYVTNLKNKMSDLTDNYFIAEQKLQIAIESFVQIKVNLLNLNLLLHKAKDEESFKKDKEIILNKFKKNQINFYSMILSLKKLKVNPYIGKLITTLYLNSSDYLLTIENIINTSQMDNLITFEKNIELSNNAYIKIRNDLNLIPEILIQKAIELKNNDSIINQYFPSILIISFIISLIVGGSFIYVSRREVRKSILTHTSQSLTEAYQYAQDCIQTLEICKEINEIGVKEFKKNCANLSDEEKRSEMAKITKKFEEIINKIEINFDIRKKLHTEQSHKLRLSQNKTKKLQKKV